VGTDAAANLSSWKDTATMIDYLILLLTTDWFLPYWKEIGIDIPENEKSDIQRGCRHIIERILNGTGSFYFVSFSEERKRMTSNEFFALLQQWGVERDFQATFDEWAKMTPGELTAVFKCAMLNEEIPSADGSSDIPFLEFAIRAEVMKAWDIHSLKASVFRDICLNSNTNWDLRTQELLSSPRTLVNHLWRVLLDHRLRVFWIDLRKCLSSQQLQELVAWYRTVVKTKAHEDRPDLIPSYIS
jgi:hypothetical protein